MGSPVRGDIVVIWFPFSDYSDAKKRPALVLGNPDREDVIMCQITSQAVKDRHAVSLSDNDFTVGGLKLKSHIRPNRIFTAHKGGIERVIGHLKDSKVREVVAKLMAILGG